jgi:hypothetical protein
MDWACIMHEMRNAYNIFLGKPGGKRPLRRPRHRWKDIRINPEEIVWEGVHWIHLAQNGDQWWTYVNTAVNLQVP